jgi:hypothetical protein
MRGLKRLDALHRYGASEIMTTEQGSQFTSAAFISVLKAADVHVRINGRGCLHHSRGFYSLFISRDGLLPVRLGFDDLDDLKEDYRGHRLRPRGAFPRSDGKLAW